MNNMTDADIRKIINGALEYVNEIVPILPRARWGVCDLTYEKQYNGLYNRGIIILLPFYKMMTLKDYNEPEAALLLQTTLRQRSEVSAALAKAFEDAGIPYKIPIIPQKKTNYKVEFSVKEAAVRAGMGWIGKNDLLVTKEYGPRFSLCGAVIKADNLIPGTPVTESNCGNCSECVKACPYNLIKGNTWAPGLPREELVNYEGCSKERAKAKPILGRKLVCSKCMISCPYGTIEK